MIGSSSLAAREWSRLEAAARPLSLLFDMEAKSVITFPSGEMNLPEPGFYEITGLAWSGRGKIARVEISTDGGTSWSLAAAEPEVRIHSPPAASHANLIIARSPAPPMRLHNSVAANI
jgi:Mo-co oxidoreductase dimerisation domain